MKTLHAVCVGLVIMIAPQVRAGDETQTAARFTNVTFEQTEQELYNGLKSTNPDVLASVSLTIKDLRELYPERSLSKMIIPLMAVVKNEDMPCAARTTAAIALHSLNSARGDFAIKRTALYTNCERTKHICNWLTYYRHVEENAELAVQEIADSFVRNVEPLEEDVAELVY